MSVSASIVMSSDTHVEVMTQGYHDEVDDVDRRIASFELGDWRGRITVQGDPEVMLALVDRIRSEVAAAVGKAWPVEQAHEAVGV